MNFFFLSVCVSRFSEHRYSKGRKKVHSMVSIILMIENDSTPGGESENLKVKTNNCKLLESLSCDRLSSLVTVTEHARHSTSDRWLFSLSHFLLSNYNVYRDRQDVLK